MAVQEHYFHNHAAIVRLSIYRILLELILFPSLFVMSHITESGGSIFDDFLTPYQTFHGPLHRNHRDTRSCQSVKYGNVTHTKYHAYSNKITQLPLVEAHYILKETGVFAWDKKLVYVNHQVVNNPLTTWSVLEPKQPGTCQNGTAERATVQVTAQQKQCVVASNAGFFNTHTGQCLGNIVSDEFLVQDSGGIQNVHFGVTKDGYIYTGYLSELDLLVQDFSQLIGGVMWLVRDGEKYVDESKSIECPDTEETGTVERFITVVSARTAVGHDAEGRIHMVQVNGKTDISGLDLYSFADLLIELGLVNAINLDGGGSATTFVNGSVVNYPTDHCTNSSYNCPREVSTILCVHPPKCSPIDCSGHGSCEMGVCKCQGYWTGNSCDKLECPGSCSWHGRCTQDGCRCQPGWKGDNCSNACDEGFYGTNCSLPCTCEAGAPCNSVTGACTCPSGYTGKYCQSICPVSYYGYGCYESCACKDSCFCHHVTGSCNVTNMESSDVLTAGMCLAKQEIKRKHLGPDKREQYNFCMASLLAVTITAAISLSANVLLIYLMLKMSRSQRRILNREVRLAVKNAIWKMMSAKADSENDDDDDDDFFYSKKKKSDNILRDVGGLDEAVGGVEDNLAGSGEEEGDLFLPPKRVSGRGK